MRSKLFFLFAALTLGVLLAACQPQATSTPRPTAAPSATPEATEAATEDATEAVAESATEEATEAATEEATEAATEEATEAVAEVTEAATEEATEAATEEATVVAMEPTTVPTEATEEATEAATEEGTEVASTGFGGIQSVCLVTDVGRVNDGTFNQFAYEGMQRAAEDLGLENTFIETQAQTDYATNISTCLDEGYDAIVTVGFLIADATLAAAEANPGTYFIGVDQYVADGPSNYVGIQFREDQAGFLVGAMAALVTESGTIAGVYGIDIPPVIKFRNGYEQGARYINPDINILGVYIDSFTAADRGAAAAEQFIGDGADVVFGAGGPTGSGAIAFAATQDNVWVIGVDQDEYATTFGGGETPGADRLISSALKRVDNGVAQLLTILAGTDDSEWTGGNIYVLEVANDGIGFAPAHDAEVSQEVTDRVTEILDGIRDGSIETGVDPVSGALLEPVEATAEATTEATVEATAEATP